MIRRLTIASIFILGSTMPSQAQVSIDTLRGMMRALYIPLKDSILMTYLDGYSFSSPDNPGVGKRYRIENWTEVNAFSYFYINRNKELLMVDYVDGSIRRIHGEQIDSARGAGYPKMFIETNLFQDDSNVYLYGGYGFWSARNRLVRISEDYRWEPVPFRLSKGSAAVSQHPPGLFENQVLIVNKQAYIFNGRVVNPEEPLEKPHFKEVWAFDLDKQVWRRKGPINPDLFFEIPHTRALIPNGDRGYILRDEKGVIELVPEKNKAVIYQHTLVSNEILQSEQWRLRPFHRKGKIYFYRNLNPTQNLPFDQMSFQLKSVDIDKFLGAKVGEENFYKEDWFSLGDWRFWTIALLLVFFLTYRLSRGIETKSRLELTENGLRYRSTEYDVQPLHLTVLRKLYEADGPVSSNDIMEIVQNPNLKYSHNNRVKNEVIRQLNIQLQSILNTSDEIITSTASDTDKRYRLYYLDKGRF